jgi:hypothetical protein
MNEVIVERERERDVASLLPDLERRHRSAEEVQKLRHAL